jgi:phosphoglucosamine mutase
MGRLFGTDGVRGVANIDPMTAEMALNIGRAVAYVCAHGHRHRVVIARTPGSAATCSSALTACSMGVDVLRVGPSPRGHAYLTHSMRADAGVVISASTATRTTASRSSR